MDVVHERAAGIDISKRDAKVAVRVPGRRSGSFTTTVKTFGATTAQVFALADYLHARRVTTVVMEATSDYWKPFYYVLEDQLPVMLVNAKHARNIPGRKSDVSDAAWLAQLGAHGLLRASFIPPPPVRQLRDLTRARSVAARDRARVVQRLEKFLESSGIKLSAVATDLTGVSARAMLEALVAGERDPQILADLAKRTLRRKIPALIEALQGRFTEHHAFMVSQYLAQLDTQQATVDALTARIETVIAPFAAARDALVTIPGISQTVAEVIIAETGADMTVFPTAAHLASWSGAPFQPTSPADR
jgi:transposase